MHSIECISLAMQKDEAQIFPLKIFQHFWIKSFIAGWAGWAIHAINILTLTCMHVLIRTNAIRLNSKLIFHNAHRRFDFFPAVGRILIYTHVQIGTLNNRKCNKIRWMSIKNLKIKTKCYFFRKHVPVICVPLSCVAQFRLPAYVDIVHYLCSVPIGKPVEHYEFVTGDDIINVWI